MATDTALRLCNTAGFASYIPSFPWSPLKEPLLGVTPLTDLCQSHHLQVILLNNKLASSFEPWQVMASS